MGENRKTPQIRFKGFTDDWEQRKLGEVAKTTIGEFVIKTKQDDSYPYPVFNGGSSNTGFYNEFNNEGNKILVSARGANAGFINIIKSRYWAGNSCYSIDLLDKNQYDTDFIFQEMKCNQSRFTENQQAANIPSVSKADVEKFVVDVPKYEEQVKIAEYLANLDNLITLHQRKCEKLKMLKKSMIEKMFSKNGEKVPEVRFKGFTDDWEQRKLGEISDKVTEKNAGLQYIETFTNSAEFGIISQKDFFDHLISKISSLDGYYIVRSEDFVYNPRISVTAPVGPINRNKLGRNGVMSPLYTVFRPHEVDNTCLEHFFKSRYWHAYMYFNGDSGARSDRFSIKDDLFFQMPIPLPHIEEQKKIGEYLTNLDNLITLHQRKVEKLEIVKKSMLEKMFV